MEKTLILLKPDCVQKTLCGKVIARFEEAGFSLRACKMMNLSSEILREHYAHIADMPFYPEVEKFMQETAVIAIVLEGDNIIERMREMLGVTDCKEAAEGTIRSDWGSKDDNNSKMKNICHASDSVENAEVEILRFFSADEVL
ncbi:nucleoside-diphosphate kinase [Candidatus Peregrinibacteria bacterium]|jgi:nucleoside-diphosphate kinase|nr:nucleoside-diphosphate kinase [Candidatus Peregrinibacteria bacterium]MBT3598709.1 nucleoside-diphosphate kinase [Candidatus Peregrinibacteria bacterium]MBT4585476.1 nucleoside-diphosphate kinase [Candidatus Peregrinibacteria bacterium]MBT6731281.1 nucleoside-diphosphate kinase [Candidatus Peregrinibacteria bacterium]MBT7008859.1 nucleoside-diphosphate kinase [Candidatus Peregrinibacteria bacterium]